MYDLQINIVHLLKLHPSEFTLQPSKRTVIAEYYDELVRISLIVTKNTLPLLTNSFPAGFCAAQ
jgi:hypothetical protein